MALTHPTFGAEGNYEQLEFVGDAVVRLAASEFLWETYPDCSVGEFSEIRANLVSDRTLAQIADGYGFEQFLLMDKSAAADASGRESRLADALEAVLGALYLSTGTLKLVRFWLDSHFQQLTAELRTDPALGNYKAALQEFTQGTYKVLPIYETQEMERMPGIPLMFVSTVKINGQVWGQGQGQSKKAAEQAAAKVAFEQLKIKMVNS